MKKMFLSLMMLISALAVNAQKFALIDMEYILKNIPAYEKATKEMDNLSQQWQKSIEIKVNEAKALYESYQESASTMNDSQRAAKEKTVIDKEKEVAELKQKYFGPEGEAMKKREELITPIENSIYNAVKTIATQKGYDAVIDRASNQSMIFASPRIDISNEVLAKLGYSK